MKSNLPNQSPIQHGILASMLAFCLTCATPALADASGATAPAVTKKPVAIAVAPPDFTQGGKRDESHDWQLGPTGARGWMFVRREDLTAMSRQILITAVDAGSPADGVLKVNDVIVGVLGKPFSDDARKSFGRAIAAAEEKTGSLPLMVWRDGHTSTMVLKLQVLGAYSGTAPYNCPKSRKIFEQGCRLIARKGLGKGRTEGGTMVDYINGLALLASGKAEYRPMIAEFAHQLAPSIKSGLMCWYYAYGNLFLTEYFLATGDQSVLPDIRRLSVEASKGQAMNGMWGHQFALPNGHSEGYGSMNQVGLAMATSLVLARQAGISDPSVDLAISRSTSLLRWFVDKGAIPYGDFQPNWMLHDENGKNSCAAVLFDLLGDREACAHFSRTSVAAYDERERGHAGNFWNILWALPGSSRAGALATGTYLKEQAWYYDLARDWKGGFVYQMTNDGEEYMKYAGWDLTGCYLLSYALPLKSLYVIGKKPSVAPPMDMQEAAEVIAAGRDFFPIRPKHGKNGYNLRPVADLLAGLSSWSPAVRQRSAQALGNRNGDFVPEVVKLLASPERHTRYGACQALACLGKRADPAVLSLRALLKDPDPWLAALACYAIAGLSPEVAKGSVNDLLMLAGSKNPADPRETAKRAAADVLFGYRGGRNFLQESLKDIDRRLLYPSIESILGNDNGATRGTLTHYKLYDKLTDHDLAELLPAIVVSIDQVAPSNEMFADAIRLSGLDLVSRLRIREGMALCVSVMEMDRWGKKDRIPVCLECLSRYGIHAKAMLPQLNAVLGSASEVDAKTYQAVFERAIAKIEASTDEPKLVSLAEFIAQHPAEGTEANQGRN